MIVHTKYQGSISCGYSKNIFSCFPYTCISLCKSCDPTIYQRIYISPNEKFEYGYPHSNALLQSCLKLERYKPHKATINPTKCGLINDVKLFRVVYHRIYSICHKFLTSNQTLYYKSKCIRIVHNGLIVQKTRKLYICVQNIYFPF